MQCPNCRKIEKGQWRYASGYRPSAELGMEDWTHDEDLYDLSFSEMSPGIHWCPFGGLTRLPSSFDEAEFSSNAYHDIVGQHTIFPEHTAVSSATHPCPYIAYFGPIHPTSSNSGGNISDGSSFSSPWNGTLVPSEMPTSYGFPAMDVHYHSWEQHHSSPFPTSSSRVGGADQSSISSMTQRAARPNSDIPRSGSFMHPLLVAHSSGGRAGSSIASSMMPPYPGSFARTRDRVQALQAYFQQQSNSPQPIRAPVISGTRRSSNHRVVAPMVGPVASSSNPNAAGFYIFPSAPSGQNFHEVETSVSNRFQAWEREQHLTDRDASWGPFHHGAGGGSDPGIRSSSSFRQRQGSERFPAQNWS
ncbi:hypothetical protein U1Q18_035782 [Sarracenia purpurea var. burkii]